MIKKPLSEVRASQHAVNPLFKSGSAYIGENIDARYAGNWLPSEGDIYSHQSRNQGFWDTTMNVGAQMSINGAISVVEYLSNMADFEDYINQDDEVGNPIARKAQEIKQDIREDYPIYNKNPNEVWDPADPKFWSKTVANIGESAIGFVGAGAVSGFIIGTAIASSGISGIMATILGVGLNAITLNQAEGASEASQVYDQMMDLYAEEGLDKDTARAYAAEAASGVIAKNRANILLNLTSAGALLKTGSSGLRSAYAREVKRLTTLGVAAKVATVQARKNLVRQGALSVPFEMGQEFFEEEVNLYSSSYGIALGKSKIGQQENSLGGSAIGSIFTKEGLAVGVSGALGGGLQTGISKGLRYVIGGKKRNEEYNKIQTAIESIYDSNAISPKEFSEALFDHVADIENLEKATQSGDKNKIALYENRLLASQAINSFDDGTLPFLQEAYDKVAADEKLPQASRLKAAKASQKLSNYARQYEDNLKYGAVASDITRFTAVIESLNEHKNDLNKELSETLTDIKSNVLDLSGIKEESTAFEILKDINLSDIDRVLEDSGNLDAYIEGLSARLERTENAGTRQTVEAYLIGVISSEQYAKRRQIKNKRASVNKSIQQHQEVIDNLKSKETQQTFADIIGDFDTIRKDKDTESVEKAAKSVKNKVRNSNIHEVYKEAIIKDIDKVLNKVEKVKQEEEAQKAAQKNKKVGVITNTKIVKPDEASPIGSPNASEESDEDFDNFFPNDVEGDEDAINRQEQLDKNIREEEKEIKNIFAIISQNIKNADEDTINTLEAFAKTAERNAEAVLMAKEQGIVNNEADEEFIKAVEQLRSEGKQLATEEDFDRLLTLTSSPKEKTDKPTPPSKPKRKTRRKTRRKTDKPTPPSKTQDIKLEVTITGNTIPKGTDGNSKPINNKENISEESEVGSEGRRSYAVNSIIPVSSLNTAKDGTLNDPSLAETVFALKYGDTVELQRETKSDGSIQIIVWTRDRRKIGTVKNGTLLKNIEEHYGKEIREQFASLMSLMPNNNDRLIVPVLGFTKGWIAVKEDRKFFPDVPEGNVLSAIAFLNPNIEFAVKTHQGFKNNRGEVIETIAKVDSIAVGSTVVLLPTPAGIRPVPIETMTLKAEYANTVSNGMEMFFKLGDPNTSPEDKNSINNILNAAADLDAVSEVSNLTSQIEKFEKFLKYFVHVDKFQNESEFAALAKVSNRDVFFSLTQEEGRPVINIGYKSPAGNQIIQLRNIGDFNSRKGFLNSLLQKTNINIVKENFEGYGNTVIISKNEDGTYEVSKDLGADGRPIDSYKSFVLNNTKTNVIEQRSPSGNFFHYTRAERLLLNFEGAVPPASMTNVARAVPVPNSVEGENQDISDEVYNKYVDSGEIDDSFLLSIINKNIKGQTLTSREQSIASNKAERINELSIELYNEQTTSKDPTGDLLNKMFGLEGNASDESFDDLLGEDLEDDDSTFNTIEDPYEERASLIKAAGLLDFIDNRSLQDVVNQGIFFIVNRATRGDNDLTSLLNTYFRKLTQLRKTLPLGSYQEEVLSKILLNSFDVSILIKRQLEAQQLISRRDQDFDETESEEFDINELDGYTVSNYYDQDGSIDQRATMSTRLKHLLFYVPAGKGAFGLRSFVQADVLLNDLMDLTADKVENYDELIRLIADKASSEKKTHLRAFLKHIDQYPTPDKPRLQIELANFFNKTKSNLISVIENARSQVLRSDQFGLTRQIVEIWNSNILLNGTGIIKDGLIVGDVNSENYKNMKKKFMDSFNAMSNQTEYTPQQIKTLLGYIGINISDSTAFQISQNGITISKKSILNPKLVFTASQFGLKEVYDKLQNNNPEFLDSSIVEKIAFMESENSNNYYTLSVRNGRGSLQHTIEHHKFYSRMMKDLMNEVGIEDKLRKSLFSGYFYEEGVSPVYQNWLLKLASKEYLDEKGIRVRAIDQAIMRDNFEIVPFDSSKFDETGKYGLGVGQQDKKSIEKTKLMLFSKQKANGRVARFLFPIVGKIRALVVTAPTYDVGLNVIYADNPDNTQVSLSAGGRRLMFEAAMGEINRILGIQNAKDKNLIPDQYKKANKFYKFTGLNHSKYGGNTDEIWNDDLTLKSLDEQVSEDGKTVRNLIADKIQEEVNNLINDKIKQFKELGITKANLAKGVSEKTNFNEFVAQYVVNDILFQINMQSTFLGDPASYSKGGDSVSSIDKSADNFFKRLTSLSTPSKSNVVPDNDYDFELLALNDDPRPSQIQYQYDALLSKEEADQYRNIESADAQEMTTVREHFRTLYYDGQIPTRMWEAIDRVYTDAITRGDHYYMDELFSVLRAEGTENENYLELFLEKSSPIKPVYSGFSITDQGFEVKEYIKSSSYMLNPELTADFEIDKLRIKMEKREAESFKKLGRVRSVRAAYKTAIKSSAVKVFEGWSDGKFVDGEFGDAYVLPRKYLGIQQDNPSKKTQKTKIAAQEKVQIFQGMPNTPEVNKMKEDFMKGILEFSLQGLDRFKNDIMVPNSESIDVRKLRKQLLKQARDGRLTSAEEEALNVIDDDINGEVFEVDLALHPRADIYESVIVGMIRNNVIKQETFGSQLILVSEQGFIGNNEKSSGKSRIIFTDKFDRTTGLKPMRFVNNDGSEIPADQFSAEKARNGEYKVAPGQVLVPKDFSMPNIDTGESTKIDMSEYTVMKDGRMMLDLSRIDQSVLEAFGFRVPTSAHSSMTYVEIAGFLPNSNMVIASRDLVAQMGSDFDVDKLFLYHRYMYEHNGRLKAVSDSTVVFEELFQKSGTNVLGETQQDKGNNLYKDYQNMLSRNKMLDIRRNLMLSKEGFLESIRPTSTRELPKYRDEILKRRREGQRDSWLINPDILFDRFLDGSDASQAIGVYAVNLTFSALLEDSNIKLTRNNFSLGNVKAKSLASRRSSKKEVPKKSVLIALLNAAVDNENDPLLGALNLSYDNSGEASLLAHMGFYLDDIKNFFNQPVVLAYNRNLKELQLQNSSLDSSKIKSLALAKTIKDRNIGNLRNSEGKFVFNPIDDKSFNNLEASDSEIMKRLSYLIEVSEELRKVQSVLQTYSDTSGIGTDLFAAVAKAEAMENVKDTKHLQNLQDLFNGEQPNIQGSVARVTLEEGVGMFKSIYPYRSTLFVTVKTMLKKYLQDLPNKGSAEKQMWNAFRAYIYGSNDNPIFEGEDVDSLRSRLFNKSGLFKDVSAALEKYPDNLFLNMLSRSNLKNGGSVMIYPNDKSNLVDSDRISISFVALYTNPDTKELAKDLIKAYVLNPLSYTKSYARFIPPQLFRELGMYEYLRGINFNTSIDSESDFVKNFVGLFAFHNSQYLPNFEDEVTKSLDSRSKFVKRELENGVVKIGFLDDKGNYTFYNPRNDKFYSTYSSTALPTEMRSQLELTKGLLMPEPTYNLDLNKDASVSALLSKIEMGSKNEGFKELARFIKGYINTNKTKVEFTNQYSSNYNSKEGKIYINVNQLNNEDSFDKKVLEEIIHSITVEALNNPTTKEARELVNKIDSLMNKIKDHINNDKTGGPTSKRAYEKYLMEYEQAKQARKKGDTRPIRIENSRYFHALDNRAEFVAHMFTNENFRSFTKTISLQGNTFLGSFFQDVLDFLASIAKKLGVDLSQNTALAKGFRLAVEALQEGRVLENTYTEAQEVKALNDINTLNAHDFVETFKSISYMHNDVKKNLRLTSVKNDNVFIAFDSQTEQEIEISFEDRKNIVGITYRSLEGDVNYNIEDTQSDDLLLQGKFNEKICN